MDNAQAKTLMAQVMSGSKYKNLTPDLVFRLSQEAVDAGLTGKHAVKSVRSKLHQVGGAYFKQKVDYSAVLNDLKQLPAKIGAAETLDYCRRVMQLHASTAERLPIMETFFQTCLAPIAPVTSISDLACGLNPLAIPWMPLADEVQYYACDIYLDMLDLINAFFDHFNVSGLAKPCDLIAGPPKEKTQVAFLLKSIPCLEQIDKSIASMLLETIPADHILVSFPVHSLGGRQKGMASFYTDHFYNLIEGKVWTVQEFHFKSELAFLVSK